jgi:hypothetical protein
MCAANKVYQNNGVVVAATFGFVLEVVLFVLQVLDFTRSGCLQVLTIHYKPSLILSPSHRPCSNHYDSRYINHPSRTATYPSPPLCGTCLRSLDTRRPLPPSRRRRWNQLARFCKRG